MPQDSGRPTIGIALSGGSGRAMAHIGVLEVLHEHHIPIDIITACSSGTIVAASYACGTMMQLKEEILKLKAQSFLELLDFEKQGGGVFNLEKAEQKIKQFTLGKKFEDVKPMLSFVACDIQTGEPVGLNLGDLAKACRISCSVPLWFAPVRWGNRVLVDGGLFSVIPGQEARQVGAQLVIGVDIAATRQIIKKRYMRVWRGYNFIKHFTPIKLFGTAFAALGKLYEKTLEVVFYNQSDFLDEDFTKNPNLITILDNAMKLVAERQKRGEINKPGCDIILSPDVKRVGRMDFDSSKKIYLEGRRAALEAIPEIEQLINNFQKK